MKNFLLTILCIIVIVLVGISVFYDPPEPGKTSEEIKLEKALKEMTDKYTGSEKEKETIWNGFLELQEVKPKIIFKERLVIKEIDKELWIKKIVYDDLGKSVVRLNLYIDAVEKAFKKYRTEDSVSIDFHYGIIENWQTRYNIMEKSRNKWFKRAKRRFFIGAYSGLNIQGGYSNGIALVFKIL